MTTATIISSYKFAFPQFTPSLSTFYVSFLSWVKMNSTNRPTPNVWVFIAQLVKNCSANTSQRPWVQNPLKSRNFWGVICNCLNDCDDHYDNHNYLYLNWYYWGNTQTYMYLQHRETVATTNTQTKQNKAHVLKWINATYFSDSWSFSQELWQSICSINNSCGHQKSTFKLYRNWTAQHWVQCKSFKYIDFV